MMTKNQSNECEQLEMLTIERVFADAKEKHGMRWTTLKKWSMQAMLTFAPMNLKKLATWTWQGA